MFRLENPGTPLTEPDVAELEQRLNFRLPSSYRRFLLDYDGGAPDPNCVEIPEFGETDVQVFFGVRRDIETSRISWNLDSLKERLPDRVVPIACDSGGNVFCLSARSYDAGAVLYFDLESVFGDLEAQTPTYVVARSFAEFVSELRPLA